MNSTQNTDDMIFIGDQEDPSIKPSPGAPWRVLIVDDDSDVHQATEFALSRITVLGRSIEFLHAHSAKEAQSILLQEKDIAVILLDVVMETDHAGLSLVRFIRQTCQLHALRIILRTGQPGYAPEIEAIRDFDINDYKTKSELTRTKLYTALTTAIRSYHQIITISSHQSQLEIMARMSTVLVKEFDESGFASKTAHFLADLFSIAPSVALVCKTSRSTTVDKAQIKILWSNNEYKNYIGQSIDTFPLENAANQIRNSLNQKASFSNNEWITTYLNDREGAWILYLQFSPLNESPDKQLIEFFASSVTICLDNFELLSKLHRYAYYDQLSSLPNRTKFVMTMDEALSHDRGSDLAMALIDIDNFAEINDALGHQYGDRLLQAVARRLETILEPDAVLARVSGDTFGLLGKASEVRPDVLMPLFKAPFHIEGAEQIVTVCLGFVILAETEGTSGLEVLKDANIALKRAKSAERGSFAFYSREMGNEIRSRVHLLGNLRTAFDQSRLFLNFQPQINLATREVLGAEALIRWKTDDGRFVPPDRFIPLAEYSGLIIPLGEWVLRAACYEQVRLKEMGYKDFRMAVNVSMIQFRHPNFMNTLDQAIRETRIDPKDLELEITESVAMLEVETVVGILDQVKARGITVAIDDFGTGFSSLSYLQRLAVGRLKIDRSFVNQISRHEGSSGSKIAELVIQLGNNLGLKVIAEGVEEDWQAERLLELGCHEAQGYYYAKPMESTALEEWLKINAFSSVHQTV